ncbi:hypothetical protein NDN08_006371 [Rhodosorus marinus]|uniref:SHSP domain-containing protein n=1 Tax=Rhodosorus marinus TaxID=101924 RepID=A0AAV8UR42_9RHOD|nr:hypothetical protein NDN08_006371 [Rhodosorus marinus]
MNSVGFVGSVAGVGSPVVTRVNTTCRCGPSYRRGMMRPMRVSPMRMNNAFWTSPLFNEILNPLFQEMASSGYSDGSFRTAPRGEFINKDTEYVVRLEVPGFAKEDINVEIVGDFLVASGKMQKSTAQVKETEAAAEPTEATPYMEEEKPKAEQSVGWTTAKQFKRQFPLPKSVQREAISANVKDGILTITIPKSVPSEAPSTSIPIN